MPKKGTKKVAVHGEEVFLPAEQAEIEELVKAGLRFTADIVLRQQELDEIKGKLATIATRKRGVRSTVRMLASEGLAIVTWAKESSVDEDRAEALREVLGAEWGHVFTTKTKYSLARGYKDWMNKAGASLDKVKARIAEAIHIAEKKPSVKLELGGE